MVSFVVFFLYQIVVIKFYLQHINGSVSTNNTFRLSTLRLKGFVKGFFKGFFKGFIKGFVKGIVKGFVGWACSGNIANHFKWYKNNEMDEWIEYYQHNTSLTTKKS